MAMKFDNDDDVISEINVTPLVDVMLVLLIIFMISAPMMFNGVNINLPKTKSSSNIKLEKSQIILSINKAGEFFIDEQKVLESEILSFLKKLQVENNESIVYVRADHEVAYGEVAKAMSFLKIGGINKISLITEKEK